MAWAVLYAANAAFAAGLGMWSSPSQSRNGLSKGLSVLTLVLTRIVTALDDFVSNPDRYLVSVYGDPDGATRAWLKQVRSQGYGGEGLGLENVRGGALWFIGSDGRLARRVVERRTFLPGVLRELERLGERW